MSEDWSVYEKLVIGKLQNLHDDVKELKSTLNSHIQEEAQFQSKVNSLEARFKIMIAFFLAITAPVVSFGFNYFLRHSH